MTLNLPTVCLLLASLVLCGCSTTPARQQTATRTSTESLYRDAPWQHVQPANVARMAQVMVNTTQGLADISAQYAHTLHLQNLAQYHSLNNTSAYVGRSDRIRECINVGGGLQGGLTCERMGHADFKKQYIDLPPPMVRVVEESLQHPYLISPLGGWTELHDMQVDFMVLEYDRMQQASDQMNRLIRQAPR